MEIDSPEPEIEEDNEELDPDDVLYVGILESEEKMDLGGILLTVAIPATVIGYNSFR